MAVQQISSANTIPAANSSKNATSLSKDDFLKILITQLQYQDPLEPMKPDQFLNQLSQLTQVEQLQNMAKSLDDLKGIADKGNISQWVTAIGKKMNVEDNVLSPGDETYLVPTGDYDKITLALKSQTDGSVKQLSFKKGEALVYKNEGQDTLLAAVTATKDSKTVECKLSVYRTVKAVQSGETGMVLVANDGKTYAASSIKQIKE